MLGFYTGEFLMGPVLGSAGAPRPAVAKGVPVVFVYPSKFHLHNKDQGLNSATHAELSEQGESACDTCVIRRCNAERETTSTLCGSNVHRW